MSKRIEVPKLGVEVTPLNADEVAALIHQAVSLRTPLRIGNHNLHGVYLYHTDEVYRAYCDSSDLLLIDGWPIWLAAKLSSNDTPGPESRIGSSDWLQRILELGQPLSICAIGGTPESASAAQTAITRDFRNITWRGFHGFEQHNTPSDELLAAISESDIVIVGMGMPRQESWILENASILDSKVVANVGGCIDYFSGTQKHAPRWLGRIGLEWLYRFAASPRRLAGRYFVEPFALLRILNANWQSTKAQG